MALESYLSFIKAHEKLIIIVIAALLLWHFGDAGLKAWIDRKGDAAVAADKRADDLEAANKTLASQVADLQIAVNKASAQREVDTTKQKKTDDGMNVADLASRLQVLLKSKPQDITFLPNQTVQLSSTASHQVADDLEDLSKLKVDLVDLTNLNGQQEKLISSLQLELVAEKDSHKKDVAFEKAKEKRSWLRGFKTGIIVGAVGVEAIRVAIFHKL